MFINADVSELRLLCCIVPVAVWCLAGMEGLGLFTCRYKVLSEGWPELPEKYFVLEAEGAWNFHVEYLLVLVVYLQPALHS